jgi:hypothetical protein
LLTFFIGEIKMGIRDYFEGTAGTTQNTCDVMTTGNMSPTVTKSFKSLSKGAYKFETALDAKTKGAINVIGIEIDAVPGTPDATFFVAEEPAIEGL